MRKTKKRISRVMTKMICLVLFVAMCLPLTAGLGFTVNAATEEIDWSATEITIDTADELIEFGEQLVAGGTDNNYFNGQKIKLGADIVLNTPEQVASHNPGKLWPLTQGEDVRFRGTFDGQGYTISGLYMKATANHAGMFGTLGSGAATVQNFALVDSYFQTSAQYMGALFGTVQGTDSDSTVEAAVEIDNVYVDATLVSTNTGTGANYDLGGFVGHVRDYATLTITNSVFAGRVITQHNKANFVGRAVGGFVGHTSHNATALNFGNCAFYGEVRSYGNRVGGFVGHSEAGKITIASCISMGDILPGVGAYTPQWEGAFGGRWTPTGNVITNSIYCDTYRAYASGVYNYTTEALIIGTGDSTNNLDYTTFEAQTDLKNVSKADQPAWTGATAYATVTENGMEGWTETVTRPLPTTLKNTVTDVPNPTLRTSYDFSWYGDTTGDSFTLSDAGDLLGFSHLLTVGVTFAGKIITLANDIDLNPGYTGEGGMPANLWSDTTSTSNSYVEFQGTFDGQGHTISGIYYAAIGDRGALFGDTLTTGATLKNFAIVNSYITTHSNTVATLLANVTAPVTVSGVYLAPMMDIMAPNNSGNANIGGFVGYCNSSLGITDSVFNGTITVSEYSRPTSAFVARTEAAAQVSFEDCAFYGTISSAGNWVGAFVGRDVASALISINRCVAAGFQQTIPGTDEWDAALMGHVQLSETQAAGNVADYLQVTNSVYTQTFYNAGASQCEAPLGRGNGTTTTVGPIINADTEGLKLVKVDHDKLREWVGTVPATELATCGMTDHWSTRSDIHPLPNGVLFAEKFMRDEPAVDTTWYHSGHTVFHLYDEADLLGFAQMIADGNNFSGKTVQIHNDMDLNPNWVAGASAPEVVWPNTTDKEFCGTVDGLKHTISGIYYAPTATYGALFGKTTGGSSTLKDFAIVNSYITSTYNYTATLLSNVTASATISGVYLAPTIVSSEAQTAGFVALCNGGTLHISDSVFNGSILVTANKRPTAGFVARAQNNKAVVTLEDCAFYGTLYTRGNWSSGLVGRNNNDKSAAKVTISRCISAGLQQSNNTTCEWDASLMGHVMWLSSQNADTVSITNSIYTQSWYNVGKSQCDNPVGYGNSTYPQGDTINAAAGDLNLVKVDLDQLREWVGTVPATELATCGMTEDWSTLSDIHPLPNGALFAEKFMREQPAADTSWYNTSGHTVFHLYDEADLLGFAQLIADGHNFYNISDTKKVVQTVQIHNDMDLNPNWVAGASAPEVVWPNTTGKHFRGTLNGLGHTLSGIYLAGTGIDVGLFGNATSGTTTIQNLAITNSYVFAPERESGVLLGLVSATAVIDNVYVDATMMSGITELPEGSTDTSITDQDIGGFVGKVTGTATVDSSIFAGTVTTAGTGCDVRPLAGFVGRTGPSSNVTFTDSAFYGTVRNRGNQVGGFVGRAEGGTLSIDRCISIGHIQGHDGATTNEWQGSFIGRVDDATNISINNSIQSDVYYYDNNKTHSNENTSEVFWDNTKTEGVGYRLTQLACGLGDLAAGDGSTVNSAATTAHVAYAEVNDWVGEGTSSLMTTAGLIGRTDADTGATVADTWTTTASHPIPVGLSGIAPAIAPAATPLPQLNTSWYGDGTADTFTLNTADDLYGFLEMIATKKATDSFAGKTVLLGADIDMTPGLENLSENFVWAQAWTTNTNNNSTFLGTFDGQGHTITGMARRNTTTSSYRTGLLFDRIENTGDNVTTICNLNILDSYVSSKGNGGVGGLIGEVRDSVKLLIENVYSEVYVTSSKNDGNAKLGGLIGIVEASTANNVAEITIRNTTFAGTATLTGGGYPAGGFIGRVYDSTKTGTSATVLIEDCKSYATIVATWPATEPSSDSTLAIGGFIGDQITAANTTTTLKACTSNCKLIAENENIRTGAYIGNWTQGTVTVTDSLYSSGVMAGNKEDSVFGTTNKQASTMAKWVGYQTTNAYTAKDKNGNEYQAFDLRLLAVVDEPGEDIRAFCFDLTFDGVSKGYVRSSMISTEVTAYTGGSKTQISASEYGGVYFAFVHIQGVPTEGTPEIVVTPFTYYMDGSTINATSYLIEPAAFAMN